MKRDTENMLRRLVAEPRCRVCGLKAEHVHHIVPRRITQNDETLNLVPLCARCHQKVHDHRLDLMIWLTGAEQANAVLLTGNIESARKLLAPSAYA